LSHQDAVAGLSSPVLSTRRLRLPREQVLPRALDLHEFPDRAEAVAMSVRANGGRRLLSSGEDVDRTAAVQRAEPQP